MKTAWKWILGIIIVLVIVAAVVAVPFVMRSYMLTRTPVTAQGTLPQGRGLNGNGWNMMPGNGKRPGPGGFDNRSGPMMGGGRGNKGGFAGRFMPFGMGFMMLGGLLHFLVGLALIGLVVWGIYQLGRRSGLRSAQAHLQTQAAPVAPGAPATAVETEESQTPSI